LAVSKRFAVRAELGRLAPFVNSDIRTDAVGTSAAVLIADVMREGKPVVGYGFSSTGRFAATAFNRVRF
jgi:hypothetical protein